MLGVLSLVEDPDLSRNAVPALPQHLLPCLCLSLCVSMCLMYLCLSYEQIYKKAEWQSKLKSTLYQGMTMYSGQEWLCSRVELEGGRVTPTLADVAPPSLPPVMRPPLISCPALPTACLRHTTAHRYENWKQLWYSHIFLPANFWLKS